MPEQSPTQYPTEALTPVQGSSINTVINQQTTAEQHMLSLKGELEGKIFDAGFEVKPKIEGKTSEDVAYLYDDGNGQTFIGVFDGVGGHNAGDMAANAARDVLHTYATNDKKMVNPNGLVNDFFEDAVEEIANRIADNPHEAYGAGTTGLVGVLVENDDGTKSLHGAAVGDSLGFVVRSDGSIIQLNKEESHRQVLLDSGQSEEVADKQGNVITNALSPGVFEGVNQKFEIAVNDGDVIVFTSDGITGDKSTQRLRGGDSNEVVIAEIALDSTLSAKQKAQKLIELSTKSDDKTAVVVEVKSKSVANDVATENADILEDEPTKKASKIANLFARNRRNQQDKLDEQRKAELVDFKPDIGVLETVGAKLIEHGSDELDTKVRISSPDRRLATPLVEFEDRSLTELWLMGGSMVGVVDTLNPDGSYRDTEILLLPFGTTANQNNSSVKLESTDYQDGSQPQIAINRLSLARAAGSKGVIDQQISKNHLRALKSRDGRVTMQGQSSNGTTIIDGSMTQNKALTDLVDYIKLVDPGILYPSKDPSKKITVVRPSN